VTKRGRSALSTSPNVAPAQQWAAIIALE